ncbi:hypothetical protein DUNSADRAFT_2116 [Dunaliella salina]|uniref:Uncharacterized protein n=1 Tax=Dunaliella salina TaxID=3046 RepID=A0ABQ7FWN2_DUNSA|nr:hypothetical protein DUNSADRAFT_2116 [Dunaliella salina]|eukprot:KAF5826763.1 hypothetical protein DUNSADRAFT_2116 [Dunaliella salina]
MDTIMDRARHERAARVIQAYFKGYRARKAFRRLQQGNLKIQAHARGWYTRKMVKEERQRLALDQRFQRVLGLHYGRIDALELEQLQILEQPSANIEVWDARRALAATKVAAAFRGMMQRKKWAARDAERIQREAESRRVHAAFQEVNAAGASQAHGSAGRASTITLVPPPSARQSATVLIGSPNKSEAGGAPWDDVASSTDAEGRQGSNSTGTNWTRDASHISSKRHMDLSKQVDACTASYKAMAKHRRQDTQQVEARLQALSKEHQASAAKRVRVLAGRQQQLAVSEVLAGQLEGLVALDQLQDPQPHDFPKPSLGSERWERATQSHALALADARVGDQWWRHLHTLNRPDLQEALLQQDEDRWQMLDLTWRRRWLRIEDMEQQRPDPHAEFSHSRPLVLHELAEYQVDVHPTAQAQPGRDHDQSMATGRSIHPALGVACNLNISLSRQVKK